MESEVSREAGHSSSPSSRPPGSELTIATLAPSSDSQMRTVCLSSCLGRPRSTAIRLNWNVRECAVSEIPRRPQRKWPDSEFIHRSWSKRTDQLKISLSDEPAFAEVLCPLPGWPKHQGPLKIRAALQAHGACQDSDSSSNALSIPDSGEWTELARRIGFSGRGCLEEMVRYEERGKSRYYGSLRQSWLHVMHQAMDALNS